MALADPEVRQAPDVLETILHPDFMEIGASGRVFDRAEIIALLEEETDFAPYTVDDFQVTALSTDAALVTYRIPPRTADSGEKPGSMRSSIWVRTTGTWQLRFHQGTRLPD